MVDGLRGSGKDMLFANVVCRRKEPYISNVDYGGYWVKFRPDQLNINNTWESFMADCVKKYEYPFGDGFDFYISDVGVYMPSQYQGELCKKYPQIPLFAALSRQVAGCNFHVNSQNISRAWDKLREQSDIYIRCLKTKVFFRKLVVQQVIIYDKYDSAANRVPPFPLRRPVFNANRVQQYHIQKANYFISHGSVKKRTLIYFNKSKYDTRIFKEMLKNGS
jgi:hypothetical protein